MGIRIQPLDIEIPGDDPFKNDLLERKEPAEVLTHLIGSIEGPCVLAVDAVWGAGKTTFLRIWAQYLRNKGFPIVEFNAWETDFTGDPFIALSGELMDGLSGDTDGAPADKITEAKRAAKAVLRWAVPGIIRIATAGILDVDPMLEKEAGQALASYAEERLSSYRKQQESVQEFRDILQGIAGDLAENKQGLPLVVIIDELDRCRPSYAVELLEIAKHLFSVDHIVFVLAVNRSELAHSIKALYGSDFDAHGYLRRFFDIDFRLPEPGRTKFIDNLLAATRFNDYFKRTQDTMAEHDYPAVNTLLTVFFDAPDLSLRAIAQAIHRLGLVLASLRDDRRSFATWTVVVLILRTIDPNLYYQFIRSEVSDLEVVDKICNRPGIKVLQEQPTDDQLKAMSHFQAIIIVVHQKEESFAGPTREEPINSPLLQKYQNMVDANEADNTSRSPELKLAGRVIRLVRNYLDNPHSSPSGFGFRHSVGRIELLSADLINEPATEHENS